LLIGGVPAGLQLWVWIWDVVAEKPQLVGRKWQLDPEVGGAFTVDIHAEAVIAAGPLKAEIS
jgi:hypothetical protein